MIKIKKVGTTIQDAVVGANGAGAVVTFADQVKIVQDFTSKDEDFAATFRNLHSADSRDGKLLDAVAKGLDLLANRPNARRRVLVISARARIEAAQ